MAAITFEKGDAEESSTTLIQCSALRKNGYVNLRSRPCRILDMSVSKTGKHGHAKFHIVGVDIFTGKRVEEISTSTTDMEVPVTVRNEYEVADISDDDFMSLVGNKGDLREDLKVPDGDLGIQIKTSFKEGRNVVCTVTTACNEEHVTSARSK